MGYHIMHVAHTCVKYCQLLLQVTEPDRDPWSAHCLSMIYNTIHQDLKLIIVLAFAPFH